MATTTKAKRKSPPKKRMAGHPAGSAELRRKLFIEALLSNGENVTRAALAAGFSAKSAASQGSRLLKNAKTQQELHTRRSQLLAVFQLTTERTLREVARLAYSDPRKFYKLDGSLKAIHELDDDTAATIASVEVDEIVAGGAVIGMTRKVKQWDKGQALDKAMKHLGLYERDNEQPGAALADAVRDVGMASLKAQFQKVLAR